MTILIIGLWLLAGAMQSDCIGLSGNNITGLIHEAYQVYDTDTQRWNEIKKDVLYALGGAKHDYIGLYNYFGHWVHIAKFSNGYYIQLGNNWTIGSDGQLHNVQCNIIVNEAQYHWIVSLSKEVK